MRHPAMHRLRMGDERPLGTTIIVLAMRAAIHSHSTLAGRGQVNSWFPFKRLSQALPGKAGGAAVMPVVNLTPMRGSRPHDR
jgi:hypothetical protein